MSGRLPFIEALSSVSSSPLLQPLFSELSIIYRQRQAADTRSSGNQETGVWGPALYCHLKEVCCVTQHPHPWWGQGRGCHHPQLCLARLSSLKALHVKGGTPSTGLGGMLLTAKEVMGLAL